MTLKAHVDNLAAKHTKIDESISAEQLRPAPDTMRLMQLKREKLRIKEEIRSLKTH